MPEEVLASNGVAGLVENSFCPSILRPEATWLAIFSQRLWKVARLPRGKRASPSAIPTASPAVASEYPPSQILPNLRVKASVSIIPRR